MLPNWNSWQLGTFQSWRFPTHDGFLWEESSIDLYADGEDVPQNDYSVSFQPSIFALTYDEAYSTAATVTACGTTTGDNVGYVYATFAVVASDNQAIFKKRNEGINTETTTTLTIGVALSDSTNAEKRDGINHDENTLEGSGSKISLSIYLLLSVPFIMFLFWFYKLIQCLLKLQIYFFEPAQFYKLFFLKFRLCLKSNLRLFMIMNFSFKIILLILKLLCLLLYYNYFFFSQLCNIYIYINV